MPEQDNVKPDIYHPGQGKQLISPSDAIARKPDFFSSRPEDVNWKLRIRHLNGKIEELPAGTDWEAISRFGSVRSAVVTKPDGTPDFDRPRYDEAPNINAVAWGQDKTTGEIKIGIITQARPHADNVFEKTNEPMMFESVPMGFMNKIVAKDDITRLENKGEAATREVMEEAGAQTVLDITHPEFGSHYPNPTYTGTTSEVVFIKVDLDNVNKMKTDKSELIYKVDYIPLKQVLADIKAGKTERGYARMATSNSVILMFLSTLSAYQNAERNEKILTKQGEIRKTLKEKDKVAYARRMEEEAIITHPDRAKEITSRTDKYVNKIHPETKAEKKPGHETAVVQPTPATEKRTVQKTSNIVDRARRFLFGK